MTGFVAAAPKWLADPYMLPVSQPLLQGANQQHPKEQLQRHPSCKARTGGGWEAAAGVVAVGACMRRRQLFHTCKKVR